MRVHVGVSRNLNMETSDVQGSVRGGHRGPLKPSTAIPAGSLPPPRRLDKPRGDRNNCRLHLRHEGETRYYETR